MEKGTVELRPILAQDIPQVAVFLHEHMNRRPGVGAWERLMAPPWKADWPNHGFQLVTDAGIVGVYVAVYSTRTMSGDECQFCNLAAFCVLPEYRAHGLTLYRALLAQRGFHFTDLSPSGNVIRLNDRMGFKRLKNATWVVPNYPGRAGHSVAISENLELIRATLSGPDLSIFVNHEGAPAAKHLLVYSQDAYAYLMYRRDRRKRLPVFATPLYVGGSRQLLSSAWAGVARILMRHGLLATLAEPRVLGFVPPGGTELNAPRPKMFRSRVLGEGDIDYLYSELTLLEW